MATYSPGLCPFCGEKLIVYAESDENECGNCARVFRTAEAIAQYNIRYAPYRTVANLHEMKNKAVQGSLRYADAKLAKAQENLEERRYRREEAERARREKLKRSWVLIVLVLLLPVLLYIGAIQFLNGETARQIFGIQRELTTATENFIESANEKIDTFSASLIPENSAEPTVETPPVFAESSNENHEVTISIA